MTGTSTPSPGILRWIVVLWLGVLVGFAIGVEWIRSRPAPPTPSGGIDLTGAGATFPYPLYRRWFADYGASSGVRINYFSVGSGEGIRLLLEGAADFGAADRPLTAAERARASCGPVELPMVLGAVAVAYRLPGVEAPLRLDADVLARIFLGEVTSWDAPELRALNPGVALPRLPIAPIHRARITGTSALFARYLESSQAWTRARRSGRDLFAASATVEGNEGVTAAISAQEGAVGVVEFTYARQSGLQVAALRNAAGRFVTPSAMGIRAAAAELLSIATVDTLAGIVGARAEIAYPAVVLTRISADRALGDSTRAAHFIAFARWALREGAQSAASLDYVALPEPVRDEMQRRLEALRPGRCPARPTA